MFHRTALPVLLCSVRGVRTAIAAVILYGSPLLAGAQEKEGSLTTEFPKLSAKERSKIAAREDQDARQDQAYQALMEQAEAHFRSGELEKALEGFEQARKLRPYNVYPKVKIEDLKAMIAARTPEAGPSTVVNDPPPPAPAVVPVVEQDPVNAPVVVKPKVETPPPPIPRTDRTAVPEARHERVGQAPVVVAVPGERRYKEGQAHVIERTEDAEDGPVVYKRAAHPSGQVFYFKNGRSIEAREWNARFGER